MPEQPIIPETPLQRIILEQALAFARQLEHAACDAHPGQLLDGCERAALNHGRQFLRDALAATLQQRICREEKKGLLSAPVHVASDAATKARTPEPS